MAKLDAAKFAEFLKARARAKDGYIMCTIGENPRKLNEWYFSGQYKGEQLKKANYWRRLALSTNLIKT